MNTALSWIKAYVPGLSCTDQEYCDAMTLSGTKVEGYERLDKNLDRIVIGQIEKIERHPDADKLIVCQVNVGDKTVQIVTGAPNVKEGDKVPDAAEVDPAVFSTEEEKSLIKTLSQLPETIRLSARDYDPSHVNRYLTTLAGEFHRFYNSCRIKGEAPEVLAARLKLSDTVRAVIANCLALLGVSAPEKM